MTRIFMVVKSQRGGDGKWFLHSSRTFFDEQSAREFAAEFVADQRTGGVVGTRINVIGSDGQNLIEYLITGSILPLITPPHD